MYSLTKAELSTAYHLCADKLVYGFYINELIVKLLEIHNAYPILFYAYKKCLTQLSQQYDPWCCLRAYEKKLLTAIGYGLSFNEQAFDKGIIKPDLTYRYHKELGFTEVANSIAGSTVFTGSSILAISDERWHEVNSSEKRDIGRLMKLLIADVLGHKAIHSRDLWVY